VLDRPRGEARGGQPRPQRSAEAVRADAGGSPAPVRNGL